MSDKNNDQANEQANNQANNQANDETVPPPAMDARFRRHGLHVLQAEAARRAPLQVEVDGFIFVRHGETDGNHQRILQHPEISLNERGFAQAEAVASLLDGCGAQRIVASNVRRAWQTAEIVSRALRVEAQAEPRLRERWFGDLIGQSSRDLNWAQDPPNGETLIEFVERTRAGLEAALAVRQPTLLIAHGGTLYVLAASLGLPVTEEMIRNATPVWFARSGAGWTSHLISNAKSAGSTNIGW